MTASPRSTEAFSVQSQLSSLMTGTETPMIGTLNESVFGRFVWACFRASASHGFAVALM